MKNISLKIKLLGGFLLVSLVVLIVGTIGLFGVNSIGNDLKGFTNVQLPGIEALLKIKGETNAIRIAIRSLLNPRLTVAERQTQYNNIELAENAYNSSMNTYQELPRNQNQQTLWNNFRTALDEWQVVNNEVIQNARIIDQQDVLDPTTLVAQIESYIKDHHELMGRVSNYILTGQALTIAGNPFTGGDDYTTCNFGLWLASLRTTNSEINGILSQMNQFHRPFHEAVSSIRNSLNQGNRALAQNIFTTQMIPAARQTFELFDQLLAIARNVDSLYIAQNSLAMGLAVQRQAAAITILDELIEFTEHEVDQATQQAGQLTSQMQVIVTLGMIIGVAFGLVFGITLAMGIIKPVAAGLIFAKAMASGDLTLGLDINQKDEIGQLASALKDMAQQISGVVQEVQSSADSVSQGSNEMSFSAQQVSEGATGQATSTEEVSSSMEEMGANIRQNAENAIQTNNISQKVAHSAEEGGQAVTQTVAAMKEIAQKISIIEEIASNTNLLALNAAIEAARAGESGRGFAVVASEVRKLAERSQKAAGEISDLSRRSVSVAEKAGDLITGIIPDIRKTAELVQEISVASREQDSGAGQINTALSQLDQVIQQNASFSEEMAATAVGLASQAGQLQQAVSFFKVEQIRNNLHQRQLTGPIEKKTEKKKVQQLPPPKRQSKETAPPKRTKGVKLDLLVKEPDEIEEYFDEF